MYRYSMRSNQTPNLQNNYIRSVIEERIKGFRDAPQQGTIRHNVFGQIDNIIRRKNDDPFARTHLPMSQPHILNEQEKSIMANALSINKFRFRHDSQRQLQPVLDEYVIMQTKTPSIPLNIEDKLAALISGKKI